MTIDPTLDNMSIDPALDPISADLAFDKISIDPAFDTTPTDPKSTIIIDSAVDEWYNREVKIPQEVLDTIPASTDSISALLHCDALPDLTILKAPLLVESCICDDVASWTHEELKTLLDSPLPSWKWIGNMEIAVKKRLQKRGRPSSIRHPLAPDLTFPLWVVKAWELLRHAAEALNKWIIAEEFLDGWAKEGVDVRAAQGLFCMVGWGQTVWAVSDPSTSIAILAELLSTGWIRERHLELFASYLIHRMGERATEVWISTAYTAELLKGLPDNVEGPYTGGLAEIQKSLGENSYKHLYLPAHVDGNHWVVFSVDVKKQTICHGKLIRLLVNVHALTTHYWDPLGNSLKKPLVGGDVLHIGRRLADWLGVVFGRQFTLLSSPLPIGKQGDYDSCGICVMNAIEHAVFGVPLFTERQWHQHRVRYFVEFMAYLIKVVRARFFDGVKSGCIYTHFTLILQSLSDIPMPPRAIPLLTPHVSPSPPSPPSPPLPPPLTTTDEPPVKKPRAMRKPNATGQKPTRKGRRVAPAAPTHKASQAFQAIGFDGERAIVSRHWAQKRRSHIDYLPWGTTNEDVSVMREKISCKRILSNRAKELIRKAIDSGVYAGRVDGKKPPYMAPSDDSDKYSRVCAVQL